MTCNDPITEEHLFPSIRYIRIIFSFIWFIRSNDSIDENKHVTHTQATRDGDRNTEWRKEHSLHPIKKTQDSIDINIEPKEIL